MEIHRQWVHCVLIFSLDFYLGCGFLSCSENSRLLGYIPQIIL